ncbi:hypothetical protein TWF694_004370 [Orbilia ellipsospora]|uniref:Uncharacterized protein n=1 Tax=Orbilia ellipsospora TaxID=2528407 RepID=A0AAV9WYS7_9PEZI
MYFGTSRFWKTATVFFLRSHGVFATVKLVPKSIVSGYMNEYMSEIQEMGPILQKILDAQTGSYRVGYSSQVEEEFVEFLRDFDVMDAEYQARDVFETVPELTYIQQSDLLSDILKRIKSGIRDGTLILTAPVPTAYPSNSTVQKEALRDVENLLWVNREARTAKWDIEINENFASDDVYERDLDAFEVRNFLQVLATFGEAIMGGWIFPEDPVNVFTYIFNIKQDEPGKSSPLKINVDGPREYIEGLEILRHTINKYKTVFQRALQGALRRLPPDNQLVVEAVDQASSILDFFTFYSHSMGVLSAKLQRIAEGISDFDAEPGSQSSLQESEHDEDESYSEDRSELGASRSDNSEDEHSLVEIEDSTEDSEVS